MIEHEIAVTVESLVLDGVELPADALPTFPELLAAELRRILDGGWPVPGGVATETTEHTPLVLSTPVDVPALARALAERIAEAASGEGAWDG